MARDGNLRATRLHTTQTCQHAFRIVFVMSSFSSSEAWFGWWLNQMRTRVSEKHRENLSAVSIVHPSPAVRALCMLGWAWFGRAFWDKLHYVDRIEELWLDGVMSEERAERVLPAAVSGFEQAFLAEFAEERKRAIEMGAPLLSRDDEAGGQREAVRGREVGMGEGESG